MPDGGTGAEGPAPVATPALKLRRHLLVATLLALPALVATLVTGVLLAAGFNFGYPFHPVYLAVALIPLAAASGLAWTAFRAAGLRSRRLDLVTPVGIAALGLGIVVLLVVASAPDRGADERRNRALLAEAPPYPGAGVVSVETFGEGQTEDYAAGFLNGADEYSTIRTDALPPGTTVARAAVYYKQRLATRGWRVRAFSDYSGGKRGVQLVARRGRGIVLVDVDASGKDASVNALWRGNDGCVGHQHSVGCW
jgi:hypothetical protein